MALAGLWACSASAWAQPPDAEPATQLGTLQVTAGRRAEAVGDVPQPVTVVAREQIEAATVQTWTEALRGVPGAFVQSSGPGQGIVIVRGLKGSEVLHLVDGMRLNNAFFRNAPSQYIALVDPLLIERIELVRGPNSVLYGSDAMGGVIQLLTPEERFGGDALAARGRARWRINTQDLSNVSRIDAALGRNGLSLALGGSWQDYGERITPDDGRLRDTDYTARSWDAKLLAAVGDGEWMLSHQDFVIPKLARYHQIVPGFGTQPDSEFSFFEPNARQFTHARYRHLQPLGPVRDLELHLARQLIVDDRFGRDLGSTVDTRESNRSELYGLTLQARSQWAVDAELIYGLEYYDDTIASARRETDTDTGRTEAVRPRFPDGSSERSIGVYAHQEWYLPGGAVLDAGLRYSAVRTELPPSDRPGVVVDDDDITGSIGLLLPLSEALHGALNLGRGFRAPNVFDLGTLGNRPGNRFNAPNPDLGPETVWSLGAGLKWVGARCQGEAGLFAQRFTDRIASVPTGNPRDDGRTEVQSRNLAEARYYGLESGGRCGMAAGLAAEAVLNWTWGEERQPGEVTAANRVPPLNGRLALDWLVADGLKLRSDWLFAGRQDRLAPGDVADSRINPNGTGGWLRWDLAAQWRASAALRADLRLLNLLDAQYREHGSGIDAPGFGLAVAVQYDW